MIFGGNYMRVKVKDVFTDQLFTFLFEGFTSNIVDGQIIELIVEYYAIRVLSLLQVEMTSERCSTADGLFCICIRAVSGKPKQQN